MMMRTLCSVLAVCLLTFPIAPSASSADKDPGTITDVSKAGPDYQLQGEYEGMMPGENGDEKWGGQIIALGDGKFDVVGYQGGLPGNGWKRGDLVKRGSGEVSDGALRVKGDDWTAVVAKGVVEVRTDDGELVGRISKVNRKSPTLGKKPPEGAVVLFDGSTAKNFDGGKIVEKNLLSAACSTKAKFGDHRLHLEFRTPFKAKARGQSRGNSGMYIQSRYEVQILDSFGLDGKNNECGGIYSISEPAVNMCFPPLTWQTYDYDFTAARYDDSGKKTSNARVTIRHNDVVIHDNLELTHGTPGKNKEGPGPDSLYLQGHGNPVVFRNIWVETK
jgi:hypothetical protein